MELCSPLAIYLGLSYGGGDEDNGDLLQKSHDALLHSVPPALQQATANPHLCQRLLDTHGQVWLGLLWGHCSFLLGPVHTRFYLCFQMYKLHLEKAEEPEIKLPTSVDYRKSKRIPEKHLLLLQGASLVAQRIKHPPAMQETRV